MHGKPSGDINETPAQQPCAWKQQPRRHGLRLASQVLANGLGTSAENAGKFRQVKQFVAVCQGFNEIIFLIQVRPNNVGLGWHLQELTRLCMPSCASTGLKMKLIVPNIYICLFPCTSPHYRHQINRTDEKKRTIKARFKINPLLNNLSVFFVVQRRRITMTCHCFVLIFAMIYCSALKPAQHLGQLMQTKNILGRGFGIHHDHHFLDIQRQ
jgi:hypothetical protein